MTLPAVPPAEAPILELPGRRRSEEHHWVWVMCLLGLDYFSTLAYQPSLTFEYTGRLGPIATAIVVLITLLGALPVYAYLAGRSPRGDGSLGLLERLVRGWRGKTLVLVVLGFAATDFTMLKAISLADASVHLLDNELFRGQEVHTLVHRINGLFPQSPDVPPILNDQLAVTLILGVIGFCFWFLLRTGFNRKVLYVAVPLVLAYLVLNGMLLGAGVWRVVERPDLFWGWYDDVQTGRWHHHGAVVGPRRLAERAGVELPVPAERRAGAERLRAEHDHHAAGEGQGRRTGIAAGHPRSQHAQGAGDGGGHHVGVPADGRGRDDAVHPGRPVRRARRGDESCPGVSGARQAR